jgi:hypothetical protein
MPVKNSFVKHWQLLASLFLWHCQVFSIGIPSRVVAYFLNGVKSKKKKKKKKEHL